MNSRLHFKRNYFVCAHECLEATICTGPSARMAIGDIFHPFHLGRQHPESPTPPIVRPCFTQLVHPISIASSPLPQIHNRTLSGATVLTPAVCPLFGVKPTSTAIPNTRRPAPRCLRLLASHPRAYRCSNPRLSCGLAGFALRSLLVTALHRGDAYFLAIPPISLCMFPNWL